MNRCIRRSFGLTAVALANAVGMTRAQAPPKPERKPEDLGERLIRKVVTQADEDLMESILRLMEEAAKNLDVEFNPGAETQGIQDQVIARLDEAISAAAAQTRAQKKPSKSAKSDKRTSPRGEPRPTGKSKAQSADQQDGGESPGTSDSRAKASATDLTGGALQESRRTWGQLPTRDRDEVLQGAGEESLERYRHWIDRYYRALQETEEEAP